MNAVHYGSSLDGLGRNIMMDQELQNAREANYRDFLTKLAQNRVNQYQAETNRSLGNQDIALRRDLGMGDLDVRNRDVSVRRDLGFGNIGLQRDLGFRDMALRRDLGMAGIDANRYVADKNAATAEADRATRESIAKAGFQNALEQIAAQGKARLAEIGASLGGNPFSGNPRLADDMFRMNAQAAEKTASNAAAAARLNAGLDDAANNIRKGEWKWNSWGNSDDVEEAWRRAGGNSTQYPQALRRMAIERTLKDYVAAGGDPNAVTLETVDVGGTPVTRFAPVDVSAAFRKSMEGFYPRRPQSNGADVNAVDRSVGQPSAYNGPADVNMPYRIPAYTQSYPDDRGAEIPMQSGPIAIVNGNPVDLNSFFGKQVLPLR